MRVSEYDALASLDAADLFYVVDTSEVLPENQSKRVSAAVMAAFFGGGGGGGGTTTFPLSPGAYLVGSAFDGSVAQSWAVDATDANTAGKVVARDVNGDFSAGTITAALNGLAASASVLSPGRTINGVLFDGSTDIVVGGGGGGGVMKWTLPTDRGTVLTTELNNLANSAYSAVGTVIDNSVNLDQYGSVEVNLASLSPAAGAYVTVFIVQAIDGVNYEDAASATNPAFQNAVASISIPTGAAVKRIVSPWFKLPPTKVKFLLLNGAGVTLAATGNTVKLFTSNTELV